MAPLSYTQKQAIKICPRVTAALSVLGSGSIIYSVLRKMIDTRRRSVSSGGGGCCGCTSGASTTSSRGRRNSSIRSNQQQAVLGQTLLLGMSFLDFFSSWSYVIGDTAFPEPKGQGTQTSCNFQAFLCNLQVGAAVYSGFLAWYYCLFIRYRWNQTRLGRYYEPTAHFVSCAFPVATAISAIVQELYNPHWIRCYFAGTPESNYYMWGFFFAPIWASMIVGTIAMLLIFCSVNKIETKSLTHTFSGQSMRFKTESFHPKGTGSSTISLFNNGSGNFSIASGISEGTNNQDNAPPPPGKRRSSLTILADLPKSRRVAYQGICYSAAFILCYIFPTTSRIWGNVSDVPTPYPIKILATSMVGTQGLLNWFVYFVQPRIYKWLENRKIQNKRRQQQREQKNTTSTFTSGPLSDHHNQSSHPLPASQHLQGDISTRDIDLGDMDDLAAEECQLEQLEEQQQHPIPSPAPPSSPVGKERDEEKEEEREVQVEEGKHQSVSPLQLRMEEVDQDEEQVQVEAEVDEECQLEQLELEQQPRAPYPAHPSPVDKEEEEYPRVSPPQVRPEELEEMGEQLQVDAANSEVDPENPLEGMVEQTA